MNFPLGTALFPAEPLVNDGKKAAPKYALRVQLACCMCAIDLIALISGFGLAIRLAGHHIVAENAVALVGAVPLIYFLIAASVRAYSGSSLINPIRSVALGVSSLLITLGVFALLLFLLKAGATNSRLEVVAGLLLSGCFLVVSRAVYAKFAAHQLGGSLYSTLVIGDGLTEARLAQALAPHDDVIDVSGWFDPTTAGPGEYDALARRIGAVDRVILYCAADRRAAWAHALQGMNVHAEVLAPELAPLGAIGVSQHAAQPTLVIARGPLGLRDRMVKRAFDVTFASALLVFLAPLLLVVALVIKFDSAGPVFFRQPRIGRQNRVFYVYKFRSMFVKQSDLKGSTSTRRDDPRITRVGRIIRATSIDELPQFINVLMGDMSVIGPRPHAIYSTAEELLFWEIDKRYWHRHACKPGLTGLAQIRGLRGATEKRCDLTDRVSADLEYLNGWSFSRDIAILVQTVGVVFHRNAY